jgi:hypothetical protein
MNLMKMLDEKMIDGRLNILLLHKNEDNAPTRCIRVVWTSELVIKINEVLKTIGKLDTVLISL